MRFEIALILVCAVMAISCSGPPADLVRAPRPLVYVAIGASDSVGIGAIDPARDGWVPVLYRKLPFESRLVNLGISGSLVREAVVQQLPVALDADPDLVTIWLNGTLIVDNVKMEYYWDYSKPLPPRGHLELQHHSSPLFWKNIYLKELN